MKNRPQISVIIPFYNSEKHLKRCVNSIMRQTFTDLEIILVCDGSEDGSPDIAKKLAEEDDRIIILDIPHGGVSVARNKGLEIATGDYVMFADSDDAMNIYIMNRMMKVMAKTKADIVTCSIERTDTFKETEPLSDTISYKTYKKNEYLRLFFKIKSNEWVHYPVAKLYKRELLPLPLYPPGIRVGEDVLGTYLALSKAKNITALRDTGYYYYTNPNSATADFGKKDFDLIRVWDQMVDVTKGIKPDHAYARLGRQRINFTLLLRMLTQMSAKEIRKNYAAEQKRLLRDLRRCEDDLLRSPVVVSRKFMIFLLCHLYDPVAAGCNLYVYIKNAVSAK